MAAAGWSIGAPTQTTFSTSTIILSGIGQDNSISYSGFPNGISDWRAESKGRWVGGVGGSIEVALTTDDKSYAWWIDGYYNTYVFSIGPNKILQIPTAPLQLNQWNVMTMVKIGNNISCYHNSQYITSYFDNGTIGDVHSVAIAAPWQGMTDYDYFSLNAAPVVSWQRTYGGGGSDTGYSAVATPDGGFAILGVTKSFGNGNGQYDAWLIRTDMNGKELWNRTYGSNMGDWSYSLSATTNGGLLIGGTTTTTSGFRAWLVKVTSSGDVEWNKTYGNTSQVGFNSIQTRDGGYAIIGYMAVAGRATDVFLLKTDPDGNQLWERTYGGVSDDWGKSLIQTNDGGYAITGWTDSFGLGTKGYLIKTDQNGVEQFNSTFGNTGSTVCYGTVQLSDGGLIITGQTNAMGNGGNDLLAIRTDSTGAIIWEHTYGGTGDDYGYSVFALSDGFIFGGSTASFNLTLNKLFLVRTDLNGTLLYAGVYGVDVPVYGSIPIMLPDGGFLGVGNTNNYDSGSDDVYVLRLADTQVLLPSASPSLVQETIPPVAAVAVGSGLAFLAVFVISRLSETVASASSAVNSGSDQVRTQLRRFFRLDKVFDFITGYFKGRASSFVWKQVEKVEPEDTIAVQRQPLLAGFSAMEVGVIFFTSVFLGVAFMITNKIDLGSLGLWLVYILVAGLAVSLHDLTHRYMAWRHNVTTEYKFWFLGTIIMFITALLFGVVYSSPSRLAINDSQKMTVKQQAIVYGSGPIMSLVVFAIFLALIPLGGSAATIGELGASMNLLTATYAMMPFDPMDGRRVYEWKKWAWAGLFAPMLVLYFLLIIFIL